MTKTAADELSKIYKAEWRLEGEDISHIHAGYWRSDTPIEAIKAACENYMQEIIQGINIESGQRILDIGCGTGAAALFMAERHGCIVSGVDIIPLHIESVQKVIAKRRLEDKINAVCADILDLDFPEGEFDYIMALESMHHIHDKKTLFKKIGKWLKHGGCFLFSEMALHNRCSWLSGQLAGFMTGSRYLEQIDRYEEYLKEAGLNPVDMRDVTPQTLIKAHEWSERDGHRRLMEYLGATNGRGIAYALPIFLWLTMRSLRKSHWGLHFCRARKK